MDFSDLSHLSDEQLEFLAQDIYQVLNSRKRLAAEGLGYEILMWSPTRLLANSPYGIIELASMTSSAKISLDERVLIVEPEDAFELHEIQQAAYAGKAIELLVQWAISNRFLLEEAVVRKTQEE